MSVTARPMLTSAQLRRLRHLPRSGHRWEGEVFVSEGSAPLTYAAWVDPDGPAIRTLQFERTRRDPMAFALKSFALAAAEPSGAVRAELPSRVRVEERELAIGLRQALEPLGIIVQQTDVPGILQFRACCSTTSPSTAIRRARPSRESSATFSGAPSTRGLAARPQSQPKRRSRA